jgi:hypothetical protein
MPNIYQEQEQGQCKLAHQQHPVKGRRVYVVLCSGEELQFVANWKGIPTAIL